MARALLALGAALSVCAGAGVAQGRALDHLLDKSDIGSHKIPHQGTSHILVIPVHVGPAGFDAEEFAQLQEEFATDGAFRRYWQDVSGGRYDPIPTLADPVEYPDSCPIPDRTVDTCRVSFQDTDLLSGKLKTALEEVLGRVRDEQQIDLATFDVNNAAGDGPDGFFDGVIAVSNIAEGVALPLIPFFNETIVKTAPGGGGSDISLSLLAMAPPIHHEFAHLFGFIDLYGGPTLNGLMNDSDATLSAFSRQQLGWAEVTTVTESVEIVLPPVLASPEEGGSQIIRVEVPDEPGRYMLIENRGGAMHEGYEVSIPGVQIYSIDENTLVEGPLHFVDLVNSTLNLPNETSPYMNVSLPLFCDLETLGNLNSCGMGFIDEERELTHTNGIWTGWTVRIVGWQEDGTFTIQIFDENGPPVKPEAAAEEDGGCTTSGGDGGSVWPFALALCAMGMRRRRRSPIYPDEAASCR